MTFFFQAQPVVLHRKGEGSSLFKRIRILINQQQQQQHHIFFMDVSELFSIPTPPPPPSPPNNYKMFTRHLFFKFFLFFLMHRLLPFPKKKKKKFGKKNVTLDPRHGTLALDLQPSTLDPRQKDRLHKGYSSTLVRDRFDFFKM